jgi:hypothetical protein
LKENPGAMGIAFDGSLRVASMGLFPYFNDLASMNDSEDLVVALAKKTKEVLTGAQY